MLPSKTCLVRLAIFLISVLLCVGAGAANRPINDDFANSIQLTGSFLYVSSDTTGASIEPEEPARSDVSLVGEHSMWWTWTAPETALLEAALYSDVDTILEVGYGDSIDAFLRQKVTTVDISYLQYSPITHQTQFWVNAGVTYHIRVNSGLSNATGKFRFGIGKAPVIAFEHPTQNELYIVNPGGQTNINVIVNTSSSNGQISQVKIGDTVLTNAPYSMVVSNVGFGTYQVKAVVMDEIGITNIATATYRVSWIAIANDNFADRAPLTGDSIRITAPLEGTTMEGGEPPLSQFSAAQRKTVWWRWIAPSSGYYDLATTAAEIEVFRGSNISSLQTASVSNGTGVSAATWFYETKYKRLLAEAGVEYAIRVAAKYVANPPVPDAVVGINRYPALAVDGPANNQVFYALDATFSAKPLAAPRQISCVYFLSLYPNDLFHPEIFDISSPTPICFPPFAVTPGGRLPGNYSWYAMAVDDLGLQARSELRHLVIKDPRVVNDDFDKRTHLEGTKLRLMPTYLDLATLEPDEGFSTVEGSLWWSWTCPVTAQYGINLLNGSNVFATRITSFSVYTGDSLASLTKVADLTKTNFVATAGAVYSFRMAGYREYFVGSDDRGSDEVRIARLPVVSIVSPQPNSRIPRGGNLRVDVAATSADSSVTSVDFSELRYLPDSSNQYVPQLVPIETVTIPPFHLTLTNLPSASGGLSDSRTIVATARDDFGFSGSSELLFYVNAAPLNDYFSLRIPLTGSMVEGAASSIGAALETGEPNSTSTETIWWAWTAPATGTYQVALLGDFASRMDVFTGDNLATLVSVAGITNEYPTTVRRNFSLQADAGITYQIRLAPYPPSDSQSGPLAFQIRPEGPIPAPAVSIVAPQNEENFTTASKLVITAQATAFYPLLDGGFLDDGYVWSVEFFANDQGLGKVFANSRQTSSFSLAWTNRQTGRLLLTAKASDQTGMATISAPVAITINLPQQIELRLVEVQSGRVQFAIVGPADRTYSVRTSSDLMSWTTVATNLASVSAIADFVEYNGGWAPAGFYQAVAEP